MTRFAKVCLFSLMLWSCKSATDSGENDGSGGNGSGGTRAGGSGNGAGGEGGDGGDGGGDGGKPTAVGGSATGGNGSGGGGGTIPNAGGASGGTSQIGGGVVPAGTPCAQDPRCDDFETYDVNSRPGGPFSNPRGSFLVDSTRAYSGSKSIKVTVGGEARMDHGGYGLFPANKIYMRAMIFFDQVPKATGIYWTFLHAQGGSEGGLKNVYFAIGGDAVGKHLSLYRGESGTALQDCAAFGTGYLVAGKWQCVELEVDAVADSARVHFDRKLDEVLEVFPGGWPLGICEPGQDFTKGVWYLPQITKLSIGPRTFRGNTTAGMWIDDVAVSDAPIGCPPPP